MSIVRHDNIEKSLYRFIFSEVETVYNYSINYGETRFETMHHDAWLSISFVDDIGAGAKKFSTVRIDVVTRIEEKAFNTETTDMIDNIREVFSGATIQMYDFVSSVPVIMPNQVILVKNNDGRFTIDRVVLNNLQAEDLKNNLSRSSVFLRIELLTDTTRGRAI